MHCRWTSDRLPYDSSVNSASFSTRGSRRSSGRFWRQVRRLLPLTLAVVVLTPVLLGANAVWNYLRIDRVDLGSATSSAGDRSGANLLLVGIDSRSGIDSSDPNASAFLGENVSGSRTDTIIVVHSDHGAVSLVSIPRDLWVTDPAAGEKGRLNSTFEAGPENLVRAVVALGVPIDHYAEVDFNGFAGIVDSVGGVTLNFPAPAKDDHSGLSVMRAGRVLLNGHEALAYVRSRFYSELVDGSWRTDGTSDIGRTSRQRAFFAALGTAVTGTRSPLVLARFPGAVRSGINLDEGFSIMDLLSLFADLRGDAPTGETLPVVPRVTSGGADVLELGPGAEQVISRLAR